MAMEACVPIIPITIEQYDKRSVISFGNEIRPENFHDSAELTQKLRDTLATMKWEIWEKEDIQLRAGLTEDYKEQYMREFEKSLQPYDTMETIERSRFHTKEELEQKNAFSVLDKLIPCPENAFLFQKIKRKQSYLR